MLLFCDGMPRSATTWIYNVTFALLKNALPAADIRRAHNEDSQAALKAFGDGADWRILKCHRLDENARSIFRSGNARAIYSHRDIYDAVASLLVMFRFPLDRCLTIMTESLDTYEFHCKTGNFLCIDYESIVERPIEAIHAVRGFLGLDLPDSAIAFINKTHALSAIKELSQKLKESGQDLLVRTSVSCYDPETQWHVRHVRNGGIGYGRRYLSPQQIERIEDLIRTRQGPSRKLLFKLTNSPFSASAGNKY